MSAYWDTSAVVPLFVNDAFTTRSRAALAAGVKTGQFLSDFGAAEFASAIALRFRRRELRRDEAGESLARFDLWRAAVPVAVEVEPADIDQASHFVRRLDLTLRTPDAIHIAIAARLGAELLTFDAGMAACAKTLGVAVAQA